MTTYYFVWSDLIESEVSYINVPATAETSLINRDIVFVFITDS